MRDKSEMAAAVFTMHRLQGLTAACQLFIELSREGLEIMDLDLAAARGSQEAVVVTYIKSYKGLTALAAEKGLQIDGPDDVVALFRGIYQREQGATATTTVVPKKIQVIRGTPVKRRRR